jgi:two-component system sensor histidine kinase ChvG
MPLKTEPIDTARRPRKTEGADRGRADLVAKAGHGLDVAAQWWGAFRGVATGTVLPWMRRQPWWTFWTPSLRRRILASNIFGFVILLIGLGFFHRYYGQLIDAKVDALRTHANMVAVAIASNAKVETDRLVIDPERLTDSDTARIPFRDDAFSAFEMTIAPERITPVLRRLMQNTETRARVYNRERSLLADTGSPSLWRAKANAESSDDSDGGDQRLRNFFTRFTAWILRSELPVYRDLKATRGPQYPEVAEALGGQTTRMLLLNDSGEQMVAVAAPILVRRTVQGVVLLSTRPGEIDRLVWKERRGMLVILSLALLATLFAAWLLERTIAGPVRQLSATADLVSRHVTAHHDLSNIAGRQDEVGHLATSFRQMTDALCRRIEASDRFAQDVAHELKNPVAAARSTVESLAFAKTPEKRAELVEQVKDELKRLNRLISDVANASRLDAELARQEKEPVDVRTIVEGVVSVLNDINADSGTSIVLEIDKSAAKSEFLIDGHEGRIGQVMNNIIDNAMSFSARGGEVHVALRRRGPLVEFVVEDQGPGIPPDKLDDIFQRFYSDRPQSDRQRGKNSGLGLSISREIVVAHGGEIFAENRKARAGEVAPAAELAELRERRIPGVAGARFVVRLPARA